jgi:murein DD-endopeptidase MepM/ murein hydrolase activator NlpD
MPASLLPLSIAFWLTAAPAAGDLGAGAELPTGSSPAFREKMLDWAAPAEASAPVVVQSPHTRTQATGAAALPRLSSRFGYRSDPLRHTLRMHSGIDIPGPLGTPVLASAAGTVRFAGAAGGYGRMVEIAHGGGLTTRYAHLSRILVVPGTLVTRGETIALMGSTGRSTGSHLHFEVRMGGRAANPLAYFGARAPLPEQFDRLWRVDSRPHISQFARARIAAGSLPKEPL